MFCSWEAKFHFSAEQLCKSTREDFFCEEEAGIVSQIQMTTRASPLQQATDTKKILLLFPAPSFINQVKNIRFVDTKYKNEGAWPLLIPSNLGEYAEHFGGVCCELFKMLM